MATKDLLDRVRARLTELSITPRKASLDARLGPDAIRDLERKPDQSPRLATVEALARSLDVSPEWLAYGVGASILANHAELDAIPIRGDVAAGQWISVEFLPELHELERAPLAFTPEWPRNAQFCLRVKGTSINRRASDGDLLRCIDVGVSGIEPEQGDLVIVQQSRFDGSEVEVTAKVFRRDKKVVILEPDSTDDRHQPIVLDDTRRKNGVEARIIAVVDLILKPTRRARR